MINAKWTEVRTNFIHQEMLRRSTPLASNCEDSSASYKKTLKQFVRYQLSQDYWQKLDWVRFQNLTQVLEFDPFWNIGPLSRTRGRSREPILLVDLLHKDLAEGGSSISLHALPFPSEMTFQYAFRRNKRAAEQQMRGILPVFYFPLHIGSSQTLNFCPLDCFDNVQFCGRNVSKSSPTSNPRSCQRKCAQSPSCSYFTWQIHPGSNWGSCSFYDNKAPCTMKASDLNTLSGPRECLEPWFHFNFTSCSFTPWEVLFGSRPVPPRFPSYEPDKVGALRQLWDKKPVQTLPNRSPRDDCNLWSTALCGYNLAILANVQTFERCRQVCQVFEDCFFWTWNPQNRLCFIKDEHARCGRRDTVVLDVVSGPKDCVGDQFSSFDPSNCSQPSSLYSECLPSSTNQTPIQDGVSLSSTENASPTSNGGTGFQSLQTEQGSYRFTKPPRVSSNPSSTLRLPSKISTGAELDERSLKTITNPKVTTMSPTTDGPEWIYEYDWVSVYDVSTSKPTTKLTKINRFIPPLAKA